MISSQGSEERLVEGAPDGISEPEVDRDEVVGQKQKLVGIVRSQQDEQILDGDNKLLGLDLSYPKGIDAAIAQSVHDGLLKSSDEAHRAGEPGFEWEAKPRSVAVTRGAEKAEASIVTEVHLRYGMPASRATFEEEDFMLSAHGDGCELPFGFEVRRPSAAPLLAEAAGTKGLRCRGARLTRTMGLGGIVIGQEPKSV